MNCFHSTELKIQKNLRKIQKIHQQIQNIIISKTQEKKCNMRLKKYLFWFIVKKIRLIIVFHFYMSDSMFIDIINFYFISYIIFADYVSLLHSKYFKFQSQAPIIDFLIDEVDFLNGLVETLASVQFFLFKPHKGIFDISQS